VASEKLKRLAKERKERIGRRGLNRKGPPITPPRQIERRYQAELLAMVREIEDEVRRLIIDRIPDWTRERGIYAPRGDSWDEDIEQAIRSVSVFGQERAERVIAGIEARGRTVEQWNTRTWSRSMKAVLGVDVFAAGSLGSEFLTQEIGSWAKENATLIRSIPDQMLTQVEGIAQRGVRSGENPRDLAREIRDRFGVTESRAKLIARDQVAKLNGQLTEARNKSLGIDKYIWSTGQDERVRPSHEVLDGMLCRWDDDSVYSDDGGQTWKQRSSIGGYEGMPGGDFQCRCASIPDLSDLLEGIGVEPVPESDDDALPELTEQETQEIDFESSPRFNEYVEDVRPEAKAVINKLPKPAEIISKPGTGGSYYRPSDLSDGKTGKLVSSVNGGKQTFLHEYGHHVDYTALGKYGQRASQSQLSLKPAFTQARIDDANYLKERFKGKNIFQEFKAKVQGKPELRGLSDIFDSMSNGVFHDKYFMPGHGARYYNAKTKKGFTRSQVNELNNSRKQTETFANMFEAWGQDGEAWKEVKDLFPNQSSAFEQSIKEFLR
jgi:SPP1 gp7 family putative phage head morphogenesis protein